MELYCLIYHHGGLYIHTISKYIPLFLVFYTPQVSDRLRGGTGLSDRSSGVRY